MKRFFLVNERSRVRQAPATPENKPAVFLGFVVSRALLNYLARFNEAKSGNRKQI